MAVENKGPILAVMGAIVGIFTAGYFNTSYTVIGAIVGAIVGYIFGTQT